MRPRVALAGGTDTDRAMTLHAKAHHECFIAASVNFAVVNEAIIVTR